MSKGITFIQFVNTLREVEFPIDTVSGGDIQRVVDKGLTITEAITELHAVSQLRKKQRLLNKRTPA